ncbi:MAG: hypothetical protein ACI9D5_000050 [Candidatus Endobugula sp.]|jgi:hypothetical protein
MRGNDASTNGFTVYIDGVAQQTVYPTSKNMQTLTFEIDLDAGCALLWGKWYKVIIDS